MLGLHSFFYLVSDSPHLSVVLYLNINDFNLCKIIFHQRLTNWTKKRVECFWNVKQNFDFLYKISLDLFGHTYIFLKQIYYFPWFNCCSMIHTAQKWSFPLRISITFGFWWNAISVSFSFNYFIKFAILWHLICLLLCLICCWWYSK